MIHAVFHDCNNGLKLLTFGENLIILVCEHFYLTV